MRVLIATGGPDHTEIGLRQMIILSETVPIIPTVLTVIEQPEGRTTADTILAGAAKLLDSVFDSAQYKSRIGRPWEEIVRESQSGGYDLLIMGQRLTRPLLTRLRGIVTQRVAAQTPIPVLIAKRQAQPMKKYLICDSGVQSPTLLQLFRTKLPEILAQAEDVTVLHVMSQILAAPGIEEKDLQASAEELIQAQTPEGVLLTMNLKFLEQMGVKTNVKVRHGFVTDEIAAEANTGDYDVVVIGAHRGTNIPRFLLDDLSRELVMDVERSLLIVR